MVNVEALSHPYNATSHFRGFASAPQANALNTGHVTLRIWIIVTNS
jgi:hypothetical protein